MAPVRLGAAVSVRYGHAAYGALLAAHATHTLRLADDEWVSPETLLTAAGLPTEQASACWSDAYDTEVRAAHAEAVALAGAEAGSPVIALPGPGGERIGFFGPVISGTLSGEAAGRPWDGVAVLAGVPGFHELKRARGAAPPAAG